MARARAGVIGRAASRSRLINDDDDMLPSDALYGSE